MSDRAVKHETLIFDRIYDASPERVFAAWADPVSRAKWHVPNEGWTLAEEEIDFQVGGREYYRFGPEGDARYWSDGHYLDIVANERIISAGTMHDGDSRMTATLFTLELRPHRDGTRLVLTDQSAFFDWESPDDRRGGWGIILDQLERQLRQEIAA